MMRILLVFSLVVLARSVDAQVFSGNYPMTRTVDHEDEYHGVKIADPYRWLEEDVRDRRRERARGGERGDG